MNRRQFLAGSLAAAAGALVGSSVYVRIRRTKPNLVIIVSDTLRADHLGCYGSPLSMTPNVDALAKRGTIFTNMMSCAPLTGASHASLMTGSYQTRHLVTGNDGKMAEGLVTLAEACQAAGYETAAFVSNGVLAPSVLQGIERGFGVYNAELPTREPNRSYRDARDATAAAASWLEHGPAAPFFLWVHYVEPHGPYRVPDESFLRKVQGLPRGEAEPATLPLMERNYGRNGIPSYQALGDERDPLRYRVHYAGRVGYVEAQIGRLLDRIREVRPEEETVIVFTSDHGELLGEKGYYFQHGITLLPAVLHVPLVLSGPGIAEGATSPALTGNVDLMPTLLDLLSIDRRDLASQLQGQSLVPFLEGGSPDQQVARYAMCQRTKEWSVMLGRYKYTLPEGKAQDRGLLTDFVADPIEGRNLSKEHPELVSQLSETLGDFMATAPGDLSRSWTSRPKLSDEDQQRLRALGYMR